MGTLFILSVLVIGIIFGSKWLRKKEQASFLDSDSDDRVLLEKYKVGVGIETVVSQSYSKNQIDQADQLAANQYLEESQPWPEAVASELPFQLKKIVLSEKHRNLLQTIETILGGKFRVFVHLPLKDFVEGGPALEGKQVSYLVCETHYFNVVAGIDFEHKASGEATFLRDVFTDINKPLILFPKKHAYTEEEVREKLEIFVGIEQKCPNCGHSMGKRKLSGHPKQWVWVCDHYPRCKGHLKIA